MINRAEELMGKNGKVFGSAEYMAQLNKEFYLDKSVLSKAESCG